MHCGPTVSAGYAKALLDFATRHGAATGRLLAAAGLTSGMLDDLDNRVGYLRFIALMRAAIAETGDRALALRFGADSDFRT